MGPVLHCERKSTPCAPTGKQRKQKLTLPESTKSSTASPTLPELNQSLLCQVREGKEKIAALINENAILDFFGVRRNHCLVRLQIRGKRWQYSRISTNNVRRICLCPSRDAENLMQLRLRLQSYKRIKKSYELSAKPERHC